VPELGRGSPTFKQMGRPHDRVMHKSPRGEDIGKPPGYFSMAAFRVFSDAPNGRYFTQRTAYRTLVTRWRRIAAVTQW
jgi:hypothetical protein